MRPTGGRTHQTTTPRQGGTQWYVACTCGWVSRPHDSHAQAQHDADGHELAMANAGEGVQDK